LLYSKSDQSFRDPTLSNTVNVPSGSGFKRVYLTDQSLKRVDLRYTLLARDTGQLALARYAAQE
jgi:hypothetical protein